MRKDAVAEYAGRIDSVWESNFPGGLASTPLQSRDQAAAFIKQCDRARRELGLLKREIAASRREVSGELADTHATPRPEHPEHDEQQAEVGRLDALLANIDRKIAQIERVKLHERLLTKLEEYGSWGYYRRGGWIRVVASASQRLHQQTMPMRPVQMPPVQMQSDKVTSLDSPYAGLALASVGLGVISFMLVPLLPVPIAGAICGWVGLQSITRHAQAMGGLALSIAGIIVDMLVINSWG